jgi:predicted AAA+ superfamily ATPase
MYRSKIKQLINWKLNKDKMPLVFLGARQVGKTYLLQEFGKQEYRQMVYINFERAEEMRAIFLHDLAPQRLIRNFEFFSKLKITPEDTLIVLDEIQAAPRGITSLKYFCEEAREYQIIAAGSLLGVKLHPNESFPVGKVEYLRLHPMSVYEFFLAMGEENGIAQILREKLWDFIPSFAEKFKEYLKYYFYVGGMPEAVAAFALKQDWTKVRAVHHKILNAYRDDFSKHAPKVDVPRINMVWDSIPAQLAKENKKFIYGVMKEGARAREFEVAIQWLTDAGLLHKVYNLSKPGLPLNAYQQFSAFKLYHNDLGLLGAMSNLKAKTLIDGNALFTEHKGALTEQFVFQQLHLMENMPVSYFSPDSHLEIDFVVQNKDDEIIPIEVKAEENLKAKSLRTYCDKYKTEKAIRTSLSDYRQESWMTNVPLYVIGDYF